MRSLPILFIALAILPLSAALKCNFKVDDKDEVQPCATATRCTKLLGVMNGKPVDQRYCDEANSDYKIPADQCKGQVGCVASNIPGSQFCCCKDDLCNDDQLKDVPGFIPLDPAAKPPGTSAKCMLYADEEGKKGARKETWCPGNFCMTTVGTIDAKGMDSGHCDKDGQCTEHGTCTKFKDEPSPFGKFTGQSCCCKGDYCNKSPITPVKFVDPPVPLKCYRGENGVKKEYQCTRDIKFCVVLFVGKETTRGCSLTKVCTKEGCETDEDGNSSCCCTTDLCNGKDKAEMESSEGGKSSSDTKGSKSEGGNPAAVPTLLFPLAALAAMLAARI